MSLARMGKIPWNKGTKGIMVAWNKGLTVEDKRVKKYVEKMRISNKGKHFSPSTEFKKGENKGMDNIMWAGDKVKYAGVHMWMVANYGNPSTCEHCKKENLFGRYIDWANKDHKYTRKREDWMRLCKSCHKKYDLENNKKS